MSILRVGSGECSRSDIFQGSAPSWLDNIIRRVIHVVSTVSLECDPGLFWPHFGSFDRETGPVTSVRRAGGGTSCWIQRCPRPALETPGGSTTGPSCAVLFRRSRSGVRQLPFAVVEAETLAEGAGPTSSSLVLRSRWSAPRSLACSSAASINARPRPLHVGSGPHTAPRGSTRARRSRSQGGTAVPLSRPGLDLPAELSCRRHPAAALCAGPTDAGGEQARRTHG